MALRGDLCVGVLSSRASTNIAGSIHEFVYCTERGWVFFKLGVLYLFQTIGCPPKELLHLTMDLNRQASGQVQKTSMGLKRRGANYTDSIWHLNGKD